MSTLLGTWQVLKHPSFLTGSKRLAGLMAQQIDLFYVSLCVIRPERNNIVWNASGFDPMFMATWASRFLEEYQRCHPPTAKNIKETRY